MRGPQDITDPAIAKALAHPLRVRLLGLLEGRVASPSELNEVLGGDLSLVSYHVRRLAAAGLITMVKTKQRRGAVEHYYTAVERTTITSEAWAQVPSVAKTAMVSAALSKIGEQVNAGASNGGFDRGDAHLSRTSVVIDEQAWGELAHKLDALLTDIERLRDESAERLAAGNGTAIEAEAVLMLFEGAAAGSPAHGGVHDGHAAKAQRAAIATQR